MARKEVVNPSVCIVAMAKILCQKQIQSIENQIDNSDAILILQHPSVYTLGTGSLEKHLNFDINNSPFDIYRTERGGEVTYHDPGQIVMYPIMNLRYHKMNLHCILRCHRRPAAVTPPFLKTVRF